MLAIKGKAIDLGRHCCLFHNLWRESDFDWKTPFFDRHTPEELSYCFEKSSDPTSERKVFNFLEMPKTIADYGHLHDMITRVKGYIPAHQGDLLLLARERPDLQRDEQIVSCQSIYFSLAMRTAPYDPYFLGINGNLSERRVRLVPLSDLEKSHFSMHKQVWVILMKKVF